MLDIANVPVALLAGGKATRLGPISKDTPKALVDLNGRPFIDHQLSLLARNGIRQVVMCLSHLAHKVQDFCGDGARWGLSLRYSFDGEKQMGTGGAVRRAEQWLGEVSWIMYGDSYMDIDYRAVLAAFGARPDALGLMTVLKNDNQFDKSNVVFHNGELLTYDKHNPTPAMRHIDYGTALLRRAAIDRLPADEPSDLAALYTALVRDRRMVGYEVITRFYEIGTPESLEEARRYLAGRASSTSTLNP